LLKREAGMMRKGLLAVACMVLVLALSTDVVLAGGGHSAISAGDEALLEACG
jgi:hypothetical protein